MVGTHFENKFTAGNTPSQQATDILQARFPSKSGDTADVVFHTSAPITSPANEAAIDKVVASIEPLPYVQSVTGPFSAAGAHQIAPPGRATSPSPRSSSPPTRRTSRPAPSRRSSPPRRPPRTRASRSSSAARPISAAATAAPGPSEGIGITAAILIMLLAFGSVVAMGLPVITALAGLGIGVALLELLTHVLTVPNFSPEMAAMIGIGVGIDYALFIVTRYRQGIFEGRDPRNAVVTSLMTSGRSVLFAGSTVVISLFGLFLIGQAYMIGLATACIAAVLMVLIAALTLLPAMLGFAGNAIDKLHVPRLLQTGGPPPENGFWYRWSRLVQRRAWITGIVAVLVLVGPGAAAVQHAPRLHRRRQRPDHPSPPVRPTTSWRRDSARASTVPSSSPPTCTGRATRHGRPPAAGGGPGIDTASRSSPRRNSTTDDTGAVIIVYPTTSPQSAQTGTLVQTLRNDVIPPVVGGTGVDAQVGGETAASIDAANFLGHRLFLVIGAVLILSFLLLMVVFRSLVLPLKAVIMNLFSVGAAYGVMVAVFQWGWAGRVIGIGETGPIDPWIPVALFVVLFGLSMDYEVFLLSRIREEWLRTHDNSLAVADGLAVTGRIITAAAAIMFCVFASFVIKDPLHILKVFGLGLATAVLVDATIVRMMLVPSIMEILGPVNWWMPAWMDRSIPQIGVEVTPTALTPPRVPAPA